METSSESGMNGPAGGKTKRPPTIAVLATADTKAAEASFLANALHDLGAEPCLIDLSLRDSGAAVAGIRREEVAERAGVSLTDIDSMPRVEAMELMARGAREVLSRLTAAARLDGVVAIGGGTGSWIGNSAMEGLPFGFPKVLVTTMASHDASRDIVVIPAVVDVAGLNKFSRSVIQRAAVLALALAGAPPLQDGTSRPSVAMSMFGLTTEGGSKVRQRLEDRGFEVVVFHANGAGGTTMERLIAEGHFDAVLDWTISELTDLVGGGTCSAGPGRMDAAAQRGLPQVVVPGGVDVLNTSLADLARFEGRTMHMHLPTVPLIRASTEEMAEIGALVGRKIAAARGPVHVLVPDGGFSAHDAPGHPFADAAANAAFVTALASALPAGVRVDRLPFHINDDDFATAVADALTALIPPHPATKA